MRALTAFICTATLLASGCFESREGEDLPRDGGPLPVDAGPAPRDVGPPPMDTSPPPPEVCLGSGMIGFGYTPLGDGAESAGCRPGGAGEFAIPLEILPAPDDGFTMQLDLCPGSDADCRCQVDVSGVGGDAVPWDIVMIPVAFRFEGSGLVLDELDVDPLLALRFLAVDGPLSPPPVASDALTVTAGTRTCEARGSDGCEHVRRELDFVHFADGFPGPIGFELTMSEGETERLDERAWLRVVRSSDALCPGDVVTAAWVYWR